jgi:hypothetical protein
MNMTAKTILTPKEKEVQMLYARGKSPDMIAIRLNMKVSKILALLSLMPKPWVDHCLLAEKVRMTPDTDLSLCRGTRR